MALNGRLSNDDLATIPGTAHRVLKSLLAQTVALRSAFARALGFALAITDSYRSYNAQVTVFNRYYTRTYLPGRPSKVWNGVRYWQKRGAPMAATPGTSNHGWGQAIDFAAGVNVYGSAAQRWMARNASDFGWHWPAWAQRSGPGFEPWHYEAVPVPASSYRHHAGAIPTVPDLASPNPLTPEDDMAGLIDDPKVQAKFVELADAAVKGAIMSLLHEAGARSTPVGRNTDTNLKAYLRVLTHWFWHLIAGRVDPNARQTSDAIRAVVSAGGGADVDEQALADAIADHLGPDLADRIAERLPAGASLEDVRTAAREGLRDLLRATVA